MQYTLVIEDRNGIIADEVGFNAGSFTLGRADGTDIQLASNAVSREHARIFTEAGRCFVADLKSSNGVFVDGNRIYGTQEIVAGSQIRVGDFLLLLKGGSQGAAPNTVGGAESSIGFARLIRIGDALEGETFALSEPQTAVGRTEDNGILLADPSVSRRHATLSSEGGRTVVFDHGSSNGTRVNNHLLREPALLTPGDIVRFGNVRFVFASQGQYIDLNDYRGLLAGTNRGLVIAVSVLAALLILVAGGIGAFVLIDRDKAPEVTPQVETISPEERAVRAVVAGDARAAEQAWSAAIVQYQMAVDFDPSNLEAAAALARAEREYAAWERLEQAGIRLANGEELARSGNSSAALAAYERAQVLLHQVPSDSQYGAQAQGRLSHEVDPALVRHHRELGDADLAAGRQEGALSHYTSIVTVFETHVGGESPGLTGQSQERFRRHLLDTGQAAQTAGSALSAVTYYDLANRLGELLPAERVLLHGALVSAGNAAYEAEEWAVAAQRYDRAEQYGTLSRAARRNRDRAVARLGN